MDTLNPSIQQPNFLDRVRELLRVVKGLGAEPECTETVDIPEPFKKMVYEFLHTRFCLPPEQVPYAVVESIFEVSNKLKPRPKDVIAVLGADNSQSRSFLSLSLENYLDVGLQFTRDKFLLVVEDLRRAIAGLEFGDHGHLDIAKLADMNSTIRDVRDKTATILRSSHFERIGRARTNAISKIGEQFPEVVSRWRENQYALSDEEMAPSFVRGDHKAEDVDELDSQFLTTYCDSAQFGLENKLLTEEAFKLSRDPQTKGEHMKYMHKFREMVIRHFEPKRYADLQAQKEGKYKPLYFTRPEDNLFTATNCTSAFELFSEAYILQGETVLVSPHGYGEIVELLESKAHVLKLPDTPEDLIELFENIQIDYAFIDELSRHGIPFPLAQFRKVLDNHAPKTDLIIDGAQSIGRRVIDFSAIRPSALIGSIQKGSNVGPSPLGILMLSDEFIKRKGLHKTIEEKGTVGSYDLARLVATCSPEYLGTLAGLDGKVSKEVLRKMTISVAEKQRTTQELVRKFLGLAWAINEKCGQKIEIMNTIYTNDLSCILTCKVKGFKLSDVKGIAEGHGVTINRYGGGMEEGVSFRITFHPFMNNDALKIIGYALMEAAQLAK